MDHEAQRCVHEQGILAMIDLYEPQWGGHLLPWESQDAFDRLRTSFLADHAPQGSTEVALVDRLAWIEWRRKRLQLAERAAHMASLADRLDHADRTMARAGLRDGASRERLDLQEVVSSDPGADNDVAAEHGADRKATAKALAVLDRGGDRAYERAVAVLHPDTRAWWDDGLAGDYGGDRAWAPEATALSAFLREEVAPADSATEVADQARGAVRLQALGESLDPDRLERLLAIESRLDRQFEKTLSMLIQLQDLRARKPRRARGQSAARALARG